MSSKGVISGGGARSVGLVHIVKAGLTAIGPGRRVLVALGLVALAAGVSESATLFFVARLAATISVGDTTVTIDIGPVTASDVPAWTVVALAAGSLLALLITSYPAARLAARLSRNTLIRARTRVVDAYLEAQWEARGLEGEGHLQELTAEYCQRNERLVQNTATIVVSGFSIIAIAAATIAASPVGAAIGVGSLLFLSVALRPLARRLRRSALRMAAINRALSSRVTQTARVSQEIAAFNVGPAVASSLRREVARGGKTVETIRFNSRFSPSIYQVGALGIVIAFASVITANDVQNADEFAPVLLLLIRALGYGRQLQAATQAGNELSPYVEGLEREIAVLRGHARQTEGRMADVFAKLEFRSVGYEYQRGRPVLRDVSIAIYSGDVVGVVGPSGGGKTTLAQLLMRLRRPTSGLIELNGADFAELSYASVAKLIAIVPQDNKLIRDSVAANIIFYRSGFGAVEVEEAARQAHVHDEICRLPNGYDTDIGPGARDLSGGQRQRLGIARALLGRPQLLILDEPTSALDGHSEGLIRDTLEELRRTTTLVLVAHRPATVQMCSRILLVQNGEVSEQTSGGQALVSQAQ